MNQNIFNLLCALIIGGIIALISIAINQGNSATVVSLNQSLSMGLFGAIICYIALVPAIFKQIKHVCCDYDWAEETIHFYNHIPAKYRQCFWISFCFINIAFLFHTINFMWGNADWQAVRTAVDHTESLKAGTFSAYWLQELLFDGKILPVINNLWAFAGLSLAGVLLAIYWNMPMRATPIVITTLLFSITPYTLSILYYAKSTLGICWLPTIVLTALMLSEKNKKTELGTYLSNIAAVLLFLVSLGTYTPVINFVAVLLVGKLILKTVFADIGIKTILQRQLQSVSNFTAALMMYLFILFLLKETGKLDTAIAENLNSALILPWQNLVLTISTSLTQFATPLPFMDITYKGCYLILTLLGIFTIIFKAPNIKAAIRGLSLIPLLIFVSTLATLFISAQQADYARSCFFGLSFVYVLMFILIIRLSGNALYRLGYALAILLIFMNFVRVAYAEKVWKFGWDAETKLAERIITRLEKMPDFNIDRQYQLLQIGEKSLRSKYYLPGLYEKTNGELLSKAYYPEGASADAYNFFYQTDFLSGDAKAEALENEDIKHYLLNQARAWPAKESLYIRGNYIVIVLDEVALAQTQKLLSK